MWSRPKRIARDIAYDNWPIAYRNGANQARVLINENAFD